MQIYPTLAAIATFLIPVTASELGFAVARPNLQFLQAQNHRKAEADRLLQQGLEQYQASQFANAIAFWEQALPIYRELQDRQGEAATLGNLGIAYKVLGNYNKAIEFHLQALAIMQEIGDRRSQGQISNNLANAYESLGNYDRAIELQKQSLSMAREVNNRQGEGTALGNLGAVYARQGDYNQSIELYQQSLAVVKSINDREGEGFALQNLGSAYHALGKQEQAIDYYQQSLAIAQSLGNRRMQLDTLGSLGLIYEDKNEFAKAIEYHQQSVAIAKQINAPREQALALNNLAHTLLESGQFIEAEKQLRTAIGLLDSLRTELNDAAQISLFDTQVLTYNLLQQVLVAQQRPELALEMSEHGRSRAFVALLAKQLSARSQTTYQNNPPSLEEIKKIARAQNAIVVEYSIIPEDFLAQGKLRGLGAEIFIWVVKPTGEVAFRRVDLKGLSLKELVTTSRDAIGVRERGFVVAQATNKPNEPEKLKQLYQILVEPIAEILPKNPSDRVIFIPQESLFLVPFPALIDTSGKYLIEKHTILTAPAIQVLDLTRKQREQNRKVGRNSTSALVVGNPTMPEISPAPGEKPQQLDSLPGAETEALAIAEILNTNAIIGNEATKRTVLSKLPLAGIIHFATHGLLEDFGDGIPGAIALAPADGDNGLLTSGEILKLKLNAELVILSACNTGRGDITGDGVIGLSRSFISAGVPSVIVSLWSVPDAPTSSLMMEFYRNLQQNPDKAAALRNAMLTTMKQHPNPKDWAAFTLIGEAE